MSSVALSRSLGAPPHVVSAAEGYERWAATYDHGHNPLVAREQRHILPMLPELRNKNVLDVACGTGRWLAQLLPFRPHLGLGTDLSSAMLEVARRKIRIRGSVLQANCRNLPFAASCFHFAICSFAVSHIPDTDSLAGELARVMKPGSDLFISDLHPDAYTRGWRTGFRDNNSAVNIEAIPVTPESLVRKFYSAGFECMNYVSLCLGEPEKAVFARAGKLWLFEQACRVPAVMVCQFKRQV